MQSARRNTAFLLFALVVMLPCAASAQGITAVSGWRPTAEADPFAKPDPTSVMASVTPVGLSGLRVSLKTECDPGDNDFSFVLQLQGAAFDADKGTEVHSSPRIFGGTNVYSINYNNIKYQARIDSGEVVDEPAVALDGADHSFSVRFNNDSLTQGRQAFIGANSSGRPITLQINLKDPVLVHTLRLCTTASAAAKKEAAEAARAKDEEQKARILKEAATHLGHPDGMPCTAVARQDIALKYWNKNFTGIVALNDSEARIKAGATLNTLQPNKNASPSDQTMVVVLRSEDDPNFPRYVIGFAPTSALDLKCDATMVAAEANAEAETQKAARAAKEKPYELMAGYLGLGPEAIHRGAPGADGYAAPDVINVTVKSDVKGYMYQLEDPSSGDSSGSIDHAIENTTPSKFFRYIGIVPAGTRGYVFPMAGTAKLLFGKKYFLLSGGQVPHGQVFIPVDALYSSAQAASDNRKPGTTAEDGPLAAANIPALSHQPLRSGRPTNNVETDGAWIDPRTKLMWTTNNNPEDKVLVYAQQYCQVLRLGGFSDWRLPSIDQLKSLYDPGSSQTTPPLRSTILFTMRPGDRIPAGTTWTVHIREAIHLDVPTVWSSAGTEPGSGRRASSFNFSNGKVTDLSPNYIANMRCLCVRGPG